MIERQPASLRPEDTILLALYYFRATEMDEESLVRICWVAHGFSKEVTLNHLNQMLEQKKLTREQMREG